MRTILFVCTGNTCRSSMAEGILKKLLQDQDTQIKSAGTNALYGEPANEKAIIALSEMGIDITLHKAQPLNEELIKEADLILTMTHSHIDSLISQYPEGIDKTFTLKEYLSLLLGRRGLTQQDPDFLLNIEDMNIVDPFGQSIEVYRETAKELKRILERIIEVIGSF